MTYPVFVEMYHPDLPATITNPVRVATQAVDDREAGGWLLVAGAPPVDTPSAFLTEVTGDARYEQLIPRTGSPAGYVPVLQSDGTLEFGATTAAEDSQIASLIDDTASATTASLRAAFGSGVNVAAHGAVADGVTDDTDAIAAAITSAKNLAALTGRAIPVRLMAGTHLVTLQPQADNPAIYAAIQLPSNVHLTGMGRGATVIKLRNNETAADGHIIQNTGLDGGDHDITVTDLTVDGNGANQTQLNQGLSFLRASDIAVSRVTVKDVHGTAAFPPGETFLFDVNQCVRVAYTYCTAIGTTGTQGSGFGDNSSTDITYTGCQAIGMSEGMGFASWHGANIGYANCVAQQCGTNGFNAEFGSDLVYAACIAGGNASDQAAGYTYANSAPLGNASSGFVVNATDRAVLSGCISRGNQTGLSVVSTASTSSSCQVLGGYFSDNSAFGIYFGDADCARQSNVSGETTLSDNASTNWSINDGVIGNWSGRAVPTPAQASDADVTNPYPFAVMMYLDGGSLNFVLLDGANIGSARAVLIPPGAVVKINYSSAPSRLWVRA